MDWMEQFGVLDILYQFSIMDFCTAFLQYLYKNRQYKILEKYNLLNVF